MKQKISRREFLARGAAAAGAMASGLAWRSPTRGENMARRPNILFVLTDDQRWDAMSCMGHAFIKTPNMDRIANEGAMLDNAFVTISLCSPSRGCFLTGAYAHRHGVVTNSTNDPDPSFATFPQVLQKAGYETAFIGKWHMAPHAMPRPGFDYWLSFRGQGTYEDPQLNENGRDFQATGYMTDLLTDYAVQWLKKDRNKPFCLILSHKAVHGPFTPADRHKDAYSDAKMPRPGNYDDTYEGKPEWYRRNLIYGSRRLEWAESEGKPVPDALPPTEWNPQDETRMNYYRTLLAVDEGLGRILDLLESRGELDDTVVVFAGDNGYFHGEHRRGDKRLIYEESIRIPFLIRYPKAIKAGTHVEQMTLNIDLAPTLLEFAGVSIPQTVQGRSMVPILKGQQTDWRKSFFYEYFREGWLPGLPLMHAVRTERWKYATYPDIDDIDELYDLQTDPLELHNLALDPAYAETLSQMKAEMERLKLETGYPEGKQLGEPPFKPTYRIDRPDEAAVIYDFTRGAQDKAEDLSGRGNHGVLNGVVFFEEQGRRFARFDGSAWVETARSEKLDPSMGPWTVEVRFMSSEPDGIVLAHGGESYGYCVYLQDGRPCFAVRSLDGWSVSGNEVVTGQWTSLRAVIGRDRTLKLYVNDKPACEPRTAAFIGMLPNEGMQIGMDAGSPAVDYPERKSFVGLIEYVRIWAGERLPN